MRIYILTSSVMSGIGIVISVGIGSGGSSKVKELLAIIRNSQQVQW